MGPAVRLVGRVTGCEEGGAGVVAGRGPTRACR